MIGNGSNMNPQDAGFSRLSGGQQRALPRKGVPRSGLLFIFLLVVLMFPYRIEYGWSFFSTLSVLDVVLVFLFPVVVMRGLARGSLIIVDRAVFVVLVMPLLFAVISLAWTISISDTLKSIIVYGASVATLFLTVELGRYFSLRQVGMVFVVMAFVLVLTSLLSYLPGSLLRPEITMTQAQLAQDGFLLSYYARLSHPFLGLSNSFATILAMLVPIVLFVRQAGVWRQLSLSAAILLLAATIATVSRGVILALVTVYAIFIILRLIRTGRMRTQGIVFVFVALGLSALFFLLNQDAQKHLEDRLRGDNIASRLDAFTAVFGVASQHPLGVGSGVALSDVSSVALESVHNAYLQNLLWFGWFGGLLLSVMLLALPVLVLLIPVRSGVGREARRAVAMSIAILLLINVSQASWEGSVLRVWIYFVIGLGLVLIKKADLYGLETARG